MFCQVVSQVAIIPTETEVNQCLNFAFKLKGKTFKKFSAVMKFHSSQQLFSITGASKK